MKIFRNARLRKQPGLYDILVDGEKTVRIAPAGRLEPAPEERDLQGRLVSAPHDAGGGDEERNAV